LKTRQKLEAEDQHFGRTRAEPQRAEEIAGSGEIEKQAEETTNRRPITVEDKSLEEDEFWLEKMDNKNNGKNRTLRAELENKENGQKKSKLKTESFDRADKNHERSKAVWTGQRENQNAMRSRRW
jgi:hypothetical protein